MKVVKKLSIVVSALALVLFFSNTSIAQEVQERISERKSEIKSFKENPEFAKEIKEKPLAEKIFVRGQKVEFDVPPTNKEGRTLIPVRAVSEALDADVDWLPEEKKVVIERADKVIEMVLGEKEVVVGEQSYELDVPAGAVDGRTMVPLRFVSEILGDSVQYHKETGEIDIALDAEESNIEPEKNPVEVVNEFWAFYSQGEMEKAKNMLADGELNTLGDMDEVDETEEQIMEKFDLKAVDYQIDEDVAMVDVELTTPDFKKLFEEYYDVAMKELTVLHEEGASSEEINEKAEELILEILKDVETVTYEEKAELHLVDGEWKIYDWKFDSMEKSLSEMEIDF